ncbi:hypothetical protein PXK56_18265 [Phaeobacter gallaeciensis]|nr:hypothetical protein [Phaeobacter gallaeciensis]
MDLFLTATNGGINVENWGDHLPDIEFPEEASPEDVAAFLVEHGVTSWTNSSSMDFATEYGFEEDDLRAIIYEEMCRLMGEEQPE